MEIVGDKPAWVEEVQKGDTCISTSSAAIPCKDPIKAGKSCNDKFAWSDDGFIQSEVFCKKVF